MSSKVFSQFLSELSKDSFPLLGPSISKSDYKLLDLSKENTALLNTDVSSSEALAIYIDTHLDSQNGKVAYGGYLEARNIYNRSEYFKTSSTDTERNIHLGLDLWIASEFPIFTPLDATVHSFKNNTNFGDYGPTIILKHCIEDVQFYTLYGHLSLESIEVLKVGEVFNKGSQIATLGDASINGDYPPHLHFQIIKDLQNNVGDYPGVSSKRELEFYKNNCPDPNLILELNK